MKVKVAHLCLTLCDPKDYTVHGILQARILEVGSLSLLQGIFPTQGSNPGLPHCRRILYQLSHKGKPKNTGVGSLSLLQRIFLTQKLNQGLLNYRQIPTELSGKPKDGLGIDKNSRGFPSGSVVKNLPANAGDLGLIPDPGRSHIPRSNQACVPQLVSLCSKAWELQLLSP